MAWTTRARVWPLAWGVMGGVAIAACIVAPPPDLPQPSPLPPEILHASVTPPTPLYTWPDGPPNDLIVPVVVNEPAELAYLVRIDGAIRFNQQFTTVPLDGGIATLDISIVLGQSPPIDPSICHHITVVVAHHFVDGAPDGDAADSFDWLYMPSVLPDSCSAFDGAPPSDAAPDHLSIGPQPDSGVP